MKTLLTAGNKPLLVLFFLLTAWMGNAAVFAAADPAPYIVTIESVRLKNTAGVWATVIEPDKQVDLRVEEPRVSFFNDRRVDTGQYCNFEISYLDVFSKKCRLTGKKDFEPVAVKKGSFIGAGFELDLEAGVVKRMEMTADETVRVLAGEEILATASDGEYS